MRPDATLLLAKATQDATALGVLVTSAEVDDAIVGFHAQQAVEKSLKAALATHDVAYPRAHNLGHLIDLARDAGVDVPQWVDESRALTPFGAMLRYEPIPDDEPLDREHTPDMVGRVLEWARREVESRS